jgi:hypothetical protein
MKRYRPKRLHVGPRTNGGVEVRDRWIQIRVTSTEHAVVRARAAKLGLPVSELLLGDLRREVAGGRVSQRGGAR